MKKVVVYLDMDGTIADLYGIKEWLTRLKKEDDTIFKECAPIISENKLLKMFPSKMFDIRILTMTPKNASADYCEKVKQAKEEWLNRYFPNIKKRIYKKYGNNKNLKNSVNAVLIDDNPEIRYNYKGIALDPNQLW